MTIDQTVYDTYVCSELFVVNKVFIIMYSFLSNADKLLGFLISRVFNIPYQ